MVEYIEWQRKRREIPEEDQTEFYDTPLPHLTVFRYQTESLMLPPHRSHFSLKFTLAGREDYLFGRRRIRLEAGHGLFANDGTTHESCVSDHAEALSIHIPAHQMEALMTAAYSGPGKALDDGGSVAVPTEVPQVAFRRSAAVQHMLRRFLHVCPQSVTEDTGEQLETAALSLAESALRDVFTLAPPWALRTVKKASVRDELIARISRARSHIDDTGGSAYDLDELAAIACLSRYHFIRTFADLVGETPGHYARRRRLEAAHQSLANGEDCMTVARAAGYSSVRRFKDAYCAFYSKDSVPLSAE